MPTCENYKPFAGSSITYTNWKRWCPENLGCKKVNYESGEQINPAFMHAKISIRLQTLRVGATPSEKDKI